MELFYYILGKIADLPFVSLIIGCCVTVVVVWIVKKLIAIFS